MGEQAEQRIGHLYPKAKVTAEMARSADNPRPDLEPYVGQELTVIAWLWARTVKSPNPAFSHVDVPLASSFVLSKKKGKEAWVEPVVEGDRYRFEIRAGTPPAKAKAGTTAGKRSAFICLMSDVPVDYKHIRSEGKAGRMSQRLMAIVAEGKRGRVYLPPTEEHEAIAAEAEPNWRPDTPLPNNPRDFKTPNYGMTTYADLFTPRQLVALTTFSDLVGEARDKAIADAQAAGFADGGQGINTGGAGADAYGDAIATYLAFLVEQVANHGSTICGWNSANAQMRSVFARQAIPMTWDYAESNPLCSSSGSYKNLYDRMVKGFVALGNGIAGQSSQADAINQNYSKNAVISTDPPYYDNIGYGDLSDFFYVWMRKALRSIFPNNLATMAVPKQEELVATPYRHGGKEAAEHFFMSGMTQAIHNLSELAHEAFPVSIYYAFKQSETQDMGTSSTGWVAFLEAVISSGFAITSTWPIRTEKQGRVIGNDRNALASSVVLGCRKREASAETLSRRDFQRQLREEMPDALETMIGGTTGQSPIAPVDLAQAAIGPGMAIFSKYLAVLNQDGSRMSVHDALILINREISAFLTPDAGSFRKSEGQLTAMLTRAIARGSRSV